MSGIVRERLLAALSRKGVSPRKASLDAGCGESFLRDIIDGTVKHPRADNLQKVADYLGVDMRYLLGLINEPGDPASILHGGMDTLPVRGRVQAGAWLRIDDVVSEALDYVAVPRDAQFPHAPQWLDVVVGDSMDLVRIFDGDLIRVVDAGAISYAPRAGDIVEVERTQLGGGLIERSVKQVQVDRRGRVTLHPRSSNPTHKPLELAPIDGPGEAEVRIVGLVRQAIRQFP